MLWKLFVSVAALLSGQQQKKYILSSDWNQQTETEFIATPYGPQTRQDEILAQKALHGDYYGGDMDLPEDFNIGAGIKDSKYRWPGYPGKGTVYYAIDSSVASYTYLIRRAMDQYEKLTCIKFVERTNQNDYVWIFSGGGCYSTVGRKGGKQELSLAVNGCMYIGTVLHELGHAVGLYHEHQRSDRDKYITVYGDNVISGQIHNFNATEESTELIFTEFDYNSIMIYGEYAFSKEYGVKKTMEAKNGMKLTNPYEKYSLDSSDVRQVQQLYKCK